MCQPRRRFSNLRLRAAGKMCVSGRWQDGWFSLVVASVNVCMVVGFSVVLARGVDWRSLIAETQSRTHELWLIGRARLLGALPAETRGGACRIRQTLAARTRSFLWLTARHWPFLAVLGVAIVLAGLPLLSLDALGGHDSLAYLPRNVEFWEGLRATRSFRGGRPTWGRVRGADLQLQPPVFVLPLGVLPRPLIRVRRPGDLSAFALLARAGPLMYFLAQSLFGLYKAGWFPP